jgi:hypothetical protein
MSQKWSYNGKEFEVHMSSVSFVKKYSGAFNTAEMKKIPADGNAIDRIEAACDVMWGVIDTIYGEGTAQDLFNGEKDLVMCYEAMDSLIDAAQTDAKKSGEMASNIVAKYMPDHKSRKGRR